MKDAERIYNIREGEYMYMTELFGSFIHSNYNIKANTQCSMNYEMPSIYMIKCEKQTCCECGEKENI